MTGKRFLIAGYYGFGNAGDEAILSTLIAQIRERHEAPIITVLSGSPERTKSLHAVGASLWNDLPAAAELAKSADLVIVGGGGLFADYWPLDQGSFLGEKHGGILYYAAPLFLARAYGKRSAILGAGVGPLATAEGRTLTRLAFSLADRATVRDRESKALLESIGAGAEVEVTADLAFAFESAVDPGAVSALLAGFKVPPERALYAIAVRSWSFGQVGWEREVARALDRVLAGANGHALFVPFQREALGDEDDPAAARRVVEAMARKDRATVLSAPLAPEVTAALLARADRVLAMRLHAAIFAIAAGNAPVALAYDPKLANIMRRAGLESALLPLEALSAEPLADLLERRGPAPSAGGLIAKAREHARIIEELAALPPREQDEGYTFVVEQLLRRARARDDLEREHLAALNRLVVRDSEVASLRRDLRDITASNTYRVAERLRDLSSRAAPKSTRRRRLMQAGFELAKQARRLGVRGTAKKYLPAPVQAPLARAYHRVRELQSKDRRAEDRRALQEILAAHPRARDIFVLAPSIPWDVALFQRPQQLAMSLARLGVLIFYVDPAPKPGEHGFLRHQEGIYFARVEREVFDVLPDWTIYILSWNKAWMERLEPSRVLYDFIDDLDVFNAPDPEQLRRDHQTLLRESTVVSATADLLFREVSAVREDAILCPNGVDYAHFVKAQDPALEAPEDLAEILALGKPIVGYYGAIARWFDYELLWAVASKRPELFFLLIGPDYDKTAADQSLFGLPNVKWIGPRHYSGLPKYLKCFDVATIPFKLNPITHATSPLKLFEYMAGGKPIVTTPMKESMRYENVLTGGTPEEFSRRLSEALALRKDPAHLALTERIARENTWDARAAMLLAALGR